jgi:hypothetical protein
MMEISRLLRREREEIKRERERQRERDGREHEKHFALFIADGSLCIHMIRQTDDKV